MRREGEGGIQIHTGRNSEKKKEKIEKSRSCVGGGHAWVWRGERKAATAQANPQTGHREKAEGGPRVTAKLAICKRKSDSK